MERYSPAKLKSMLQGSWKRATQNGEVIYRIENSKIETGQYLSLVKAGFDIEYSERHPMPCFVCPLFPNAYIKKIKATEFILQCYDSWEDLHLSPSEVITFTRVN